jgi:hypothetical protein
VGRHSSPFSTAVIVFGVGMWDSKLDGTQGFGFFMVAGWMDGWVDICLA